MGLLPFLPFRMARVQNWNRIQENGEFSDELQTESVRKSEASGVTVMAGDSLGIELREN